MGNYYTSKGQGSQESYDAYFDKYQDSSVWSELNVDTQQNLAGRKKHWNDDSFIDFTPPADSINKALAEKEMFNMDLKKAIIFGLLAYYFI